MDLHSEELKRDYFTVYNHCEAEVIADGRSRVTVELRQESLNVWGSPHGGLLFTMADLATGVASRSVYPGRTQTISGTLNFLDVDWEAKTIYAEATVDRSGKTTAFCSVKITSDHGVLLAEGTYVYHLSPRS